MLMKKILLILTPILLCASLFTACGDTSADMSDASGKSGISADDEELAEADDENSSEEQSEEESEEQVYRCEFSDSSRPEAVAAELSGVCDGEIESLVQIDNLYGIHALHSGVVGLVGVPVEVSYPTHEISEPRLTFCFDENELRGVPVKNLIVLHYLEDEHRYEEITAFSLNADAQTLSLRLYEPGVYMLADAYEWYKVWGNDKYWQYAYEVDHSKYATEWELECNTGSIMDIADKEWAMENAPDFRVSTPEQLAGVVYYVNGHSEGSVTITLEDNIDLSGLKWVPIGWNKGSSDRAFSGTVNGQGYTIINMNISKGYSDAGFIGYGLDVTVEDITFENAHVSGSSCTGIVGGQIYMSDLWQDIHLVNCTVEGGYSDSGTIIGRESGTGFRNCSVHMVTVNDELTEHFSYRQKVIAETEVTETFTLTMDDDYVLVRDEHEGFRNLGWYFETDGVVRLHRNADDETVYDAAWIMSEPGNHKVYLVAFIGETYIRVSNVIEITN